MRKKDKPELDKAQHTVVSNTQYPYFLEAGAGTGKTHVLIEKLLFILENEEPNLDQFAVITFTNKATDEILIRLQQSLNKKWAELRYKNPLAAAKMKSQIALCNRTCISTIHGFCERLLRLHAPLIGFSTDFSLQSYTAETKAIVVRHVNKHMGNCLFQGITQQTIVKTILELLSRSKNKGFQLEELTDDVCTQENPASFFPKFKKLLIKLTLEIQEEVRLMKQINHILSIDDLITYTILLLNIPQVPKRIASQYQYVFIDEFQDTNYEQYLLIHFLIQAGVNVFMIGDPKQSIYAFRGADAANVKKIQRSIPSTSGKKVTALKSNYRTDEYLLKKINKIFRGNVDYNGEKLDFPWRSLSSAREYKCCKSPFELKYEIDIYDIIQELIDKEIINKSPVSYGDIAVLCRSNYEVEWIGKRLREGGVPVETIGGQGFYNTKEIVDTYKLLSCGIYKTPATELELRSTFYYRAFTTLYGGAEKEGSFYEVIKAAFTSDRVDALLDTLYENTYALRYLKINKQYQSIANLLKLKEISAESGQCGRATSLQFLNYLGAMISTNSKEEEAEILSQDRSAGMVSLYTIHKAKGLEFPIVIIPNCDNELIRTSTYPNIIYDQEKRKIAFNGRFLGESFPYKDEDYEKLLRPILKSHLEEELRIFYVACTRAKNKLILVSRGNKKKIFRKGHSWMLWALDAL